MGRQIGSHSYKITGVLFLYKKYGSVLAASLLFAGIESEELPMMLDCLQPREVTYLKGENITTMGEELSGIGVIAAGKAAVIKESAAGARVVMAILEPGDLFGEIAAFAGKPRWPATVQAQESSKAIFITRERIVGGCTRDCLWHRRLIDNILRIVSERALMLNRKVNYLMIKSLRSRICALLLEYHQKEGRDIFTLPMNRNGMADFLNVSRPSMSRELRRLQEEGVIEYHLATFRILDSSALKKFALTI